MINWVLPCFMSPDWHFSITLLDPGDDLSGELFLLKLNSIQATSFFWRRDTHSQAAITTPSGMIAPLLALPAKIWPLGPRSDYTYPTSRVSRPHLIHFDHRLVVWLRHVCTALCPSVESLSGMRPGWNASEWRMAGGWADGGLRGLGLVGRGGWTQCPGCSWKTQSAFARWVKW